MNPRRFHGLLTVICILIGILSAPAGVCGEVDRYTLPNGMVVVLAPDHSTPAVSMNIWINVGAFNELDSESGTSHFIEHLLFDGSADLKPGEGAALIEASGGNFNAYTDYDNTVLTATVASRFVETMIRVVSETALIRAQLNATLPSSAIEWFVVALDSCVSLIWAPIADRFPLPSIAIWVKVASALPLSVSDA